jgi:hypothetical protein
MQTTAAERRKLQASRRSMRVSNVPKFTFRSNTQAIGAECDTKDQWPTAKPRTELRWASIAHVRYGQHELIVTNSDNVLTAGCLPDAHSNVTTYRLDRVKFGFAVQRKLRHQTFQITCIYLTSSSHCRKDACTLIKNSSKTFTSKLPPYFDLQVCNIN